MPAVDEVSSKNWHAISSEDIMETLETSPQGLKKDEVDRRLQEFSFNELKERKKTTALQILLGHFKDIFVIMLLIATVISSNKSNFHDGFKAIYHTIYVMKPFYVKI
jgi:Ca2+-transporting ATPase